jgi:hypothetical protein
MAVAGELQPHCGKRVTSERALRFVTARPVVRRPADAVGSGRGDDEKKAAREVSWYWAEILRRK